MSCHSYKGEEVFDTFSPVCYLPSLNFSDGNNDGNVDEDEDVINILESELEIEDIDDMEKLKKLGMDYLIEIFLISVKICMNFESTYIYITS